MLKAPLFSEFVTCSQISADLVVHHRHQGREKYDIFPLKQTFLWEYFPKKVDPENIVLSLRFGPMRVWEEE